ncbi:MAG: glycosyltransferase family 4 protein [Bacteroidota bacterium]|jgi:glycosyltransferase involved in cell wall biosynthesis
MLKNKKVVLVFIDWYVPAYKAGGPIRSVYNIVKKFGDDAEFFVVTSIFDLKETHPLDGVKENTWLKLDDSKVIYLNRKNQNTKRYIEIVKEVKPDIIYLNSLFSKNFTLLPLSVIRKVDADKKIKVILAPRGTLGKASLAIKPLKKKLFFIYAKFKGILNNIVWHASTTQEETDIKKVFGNKSDIVVAENIAILPDNIKVKSQRFLDNKLTVLFISRISLIKNFKLLCDALAGCKNKNQIRLKIVGAIENTEYYNSCISVLDNAKIEWEYLGAKPQNQLKEVYENSSIFCLPTLHENYGHVIVEALTYGLPIIISDHTPWRNLVAKGVGFDLALEEKLFAEKLDYFTELSDKEYSEHSAKCIEFSKSIIAKESVIEENRKLFID